ncbi:MAG: hypothetical protein AAFY17_00795 [Cyanobacteria bacterium J06642_11]
MSYLPYVVPAGLTILIALYAFFKDAEASKSSALNWSFILIAGVLWPITLPFIVWKRLLMLFKRESIEVQLEYSYWM